MKFDETKTKKNPRDVTEPSFMLPGPFDLQINGFLMVLWLNNHEFFQKFEKKLFFSGLQKFTGGFLGSLIPMFLVPEPENGFFVRSSRGVIPPEK